ncbi:chromosome partition protein MukE [Morganella psychrotolerans]|uniref:Chromosome partition protein MukE n=1 Tax=Morganella psychrotolerans TaxID=368603 RepID=A0A5M9R994_9GAMM|nr:chromosome partition protein MukE [Morganella psychrotolerans]KAA8716576.1 chromosome partition protein MukE [Morganella psychrotolerans]OBU09047.1 chromosome partitioning protein MukE [Morganella psychrotolerans]
MSLTHIEPFMPAKLAQALANTLFPELDSQLRAGRHISVDDLDNHAFLMDFQDELEGFYARYNVELVRAPEGFFYLRPRSTTLIPRSVLSELEMLVGKVLCYLYLSPERLANQGIFTTAELYEELLSLADEAKLLKVINNRSTGSDLDKQKLLEKTRGALYRLRRLGMVTFVGADNSQFVISESVFRFGADVRSGDDPRDAQLRLIRDGEAQSLAEDENTPRGDSPDEEPDDNNEHENDNATDEAEDEE